MRKIEVIGTGMALPKNSLEINGETRYRCEGEDSQLSLAADASLKAIESSNLKINDIDLIVSASAVGVQPLPCTASLIHEKIAKGTDIPAMDINTSCTSFVSALDTVSYFVSSGAYENVLIVSSEQSSIGLNKNQKESYNLFSDGAAAVVVSKTEKDKGVICSMQKTWSEGVHATEIRGGLTNMPSYKYDSLNKDDYLFDMNGLKVLGLAAKKLPKMLEEFYNKNNININDIDLVVPHQASRAMDMIMKKLNIPKNKYINKLNLYGNMVSASIPFVFCEAINEGTIVDGQNIMLIGTAAGLTSNVLVLKK